jgi:hypothetical protein
VALVDRSLSSSRAGVATLAATIAAVVAAALLPSAAVAAKPPTVLVRIEGAGATLLPPTLAQTTDANTVRGHTCPGSSAAGALNIATHGGWTGKFETGSGFADFFITGILGEQPTGNNFWTLWVNGRSSSTGACSTQLHFADGELWFDCLADAHFNCTNNPLALSAPATVRAGSPFTGTVKQLDGSGHSAPVSAAVVTGDGVVGLSAAGGKTSLVARKAGVITLQARKSGATPSDPVPVCVYKAKKSDCPTSAGPPVQVRGIRQHQVFTHGPRSLHGTAGPDLSGLTDVSFSLLRHAPNKRCSYFDADRGRWHATSCQTAAPLFSIGANANWSYLLPAPLPTGKYHLRVVATDGDGIKSRPVAGKSVLDFTVK